MKTLDNSDKVFSIVTTHDTVIGMIERLESKSPVLLDRLNLLNKLTITEFVKEFKFIFIEYEDICNIHYDIVQISKNLSDNKRFMNVTKLVLKIKKLVETIPTNDYIINIIKNTYPTEFIAITLVFDMESNLIDQLGAIQKYVELNKTLNIESVDLPEIT